MAKDGGIDLVDDISFQERTWRVQRVGWVVMVLLVAAALAGVFARGPLSRAEAQGAGLRIEYERFERYQAPSEIRVRPTPEAVADGSVALMLDGDYAERVQVERIDPEPERAAPTAGGHVLYFPVPRDARPGTVTFRIRPQRVGLVHGRIGIAGAAPVSFTQLVWP
jgi:hypothetical protein